MAKSSVCGCGRGWPAVVHAAILFPRFVLSSFMIRFARSFILMPKSNLVKVGRGRPGEHPAQVLHARCYYNPRDDFRMMAIFFARFSEVTNRSQKFNMEWIYFYLHFLRPKL